jgi:hypothetical protein
MIHPDQTWNFTIENFQNIYFIFQTRWLGHDSPGSAVFRHYIHLFQLLGYGVFTTQDFRSGDFLLDYVGQFIDPETADVVEDQTYLYNFQCGNCRYRSVPAINNFQAPTNCTQNIMLVL